MWHVTTSVRVILAVCLWTMLACTSPIAQASPHPSPLTAARLASGGVVEYKVPGPISHGDVCGNCFISSPGGMVASRDGTLWFVDQGLQKVGRITTAGVITEYGVPGAVSGLGSIAAATDGGVWVTANGLGHGNPDWILRISSAGSVVQFQAGTSTGLGDNSAIAVGPHGDLWFTEVFANRIGRMTPAGVLTEFPIPTPESGAIGIVAGPDGNLWFNEAWSRPAAIARITPAGAITEYPLSQTPTDETPTGDVVSLNGKWFTVPPGVKGGGRTGRITPKGGVISPPPRSVASEGWAEGPDGNLWFTDPNGNAVGRISPSGTIREFALPRRNAEPRGIAVGPDGRIWFTESGVRRIASIGVTVPEVTLSSRLVNFGNASTATTRNITIANTGDGPLSIAAVSVVGPDAAAFQLMGDDCSGRVVSVRAQCKVAVAFAPGSRFGLQVARLQVADNATRSPQAVSLVAQLMDCILPLFVGTTEPIPAGTSQFISHGKLLDLSSGQVADDPNGGFVSDWGNGEGLHSHTSSAPVLYGQRAGYFDQAAGRWLPVSLASSISPDGSRYAYAVFGTGIFSQVHVVDIATGHDRTLDLPPDPWYVLAFSQRGIYVDKMYEGIGPGLWLVNPDSGALSTVFADAAVEVVDGSVAWIQARNPADTVPPPPSGLGGAYNEILKRDLGTGVTTVWLYLSGSNLDVDGVVNGVPVIGGGDASTSYLVMVSSPNQMVRLDDPETGDPLAYPVPYTGAGYPAGLVADARGAWIGTLDGVYLLPPDKGAVLVSEAVGLPAGRCM